MGSARAPVALSALCPAWICLVSKDQLGSVIGRPALLGRVDDRGRRGGGRVHRRVGAGERLSALARAPGGVDGPGPHPGHPTAVGGLPASEPGLVAGAHDLGVSVRMPPGRPGAGVLIVGRTLHSRSTRGVKEGLMPYTTPSRDAVLTLGTLRVCRVACWPDPLLVTT